MLIEDNGEALAERIRMLEHAKHSIVLSTFDFHSDISGKRCWLPCGQRQNAASR